jgi:multiple sugar transport system substrate-binding protein
MQFLPGVRAAVAAIGFGSVASIASAGVLNIQLGFANSTERDGFTALVNDFRASNPDVEVHLNLVDADGYRKALPATLDGDAAPDVFNWSAGEQLRGFAQRGELDDLSDLWKANNWWTAYAATVSAATVGGKQFALPYQYYPWGLFSRRDVLEAAGLHETPKDLAHLITACSKLRRAGFTPIALAGKDADAIGAWFDFIDLRTNGYEFHNQVLAGKVSYNDRDVRRTFGMWKQLVDAQCFAPNAATTDQRTAEALVWQGHAAFLLTGIVVTAAIPESLQPVIEYHRFPVIDSSQPPAETAPVDTFAVAARAHNKADARRFLKFAGSSAANAKLTKALGSFPTNNIAPVPGTVTNVASYKVLTDAKTSVVQGYGRDTPAGMSQAGIKGFQDFLAQPGQLYPILDRLDAVRANAYTTTVSQETAAAPAKTNKR